jgi:DNA polymerase-3 subunit gamma/tau
MKSAWNRYAQKLEDNGYKINASILFMCDPKLENQTIIIELPTQTTYSHFEQEKPKLLGYLKNKLNNHIIEIEVIINEEVASKNVYTDDDKYEKLKNINPKLELLRKFFDLSF